MDTPRPPLSLPSFTSTPMPSAIPKSRVSTQKMVDTAIKDLNEPRGSSLKAIKKYIAANYDCNINKTEVFIKKYIKSAVQKKWLLQPTGKGATGKFKLSPAVKDNKKPSNAINKKQKVVKQQLQATILEEEEEKEQEEEEEEEETKAKEVKKKVKKVTASKKTSESKPKATGAKKEKVPKATTSKKTKKDAQVASEPKTGAKKKNTKVTKVPEIKMPQLKTIAKAKVAKAAEDKNNNMKGDGEVGDGAPSTSKAITKKSKKKTPSVPLNESAEL